MKKLFSSIRLFIAHVALWFRNNILPKAFLFFLGLLGFTITPAHAAIPAAATAAFTTLETDVLGLIDTAWPVVVSVTVAFILLRVFKRAAATSV